jgi:hypothetical protein
MEKTIKNMMSLNLRLISFIESIISDEEHCLKHGKHIFYRDLFKKEFVDIHDLATLKRGASGEDNLLDNYSQTAGKSQVNVKNHGSRTKSNSFDDIHDFATLKRGPPIILTLLI